MNDTPSIIAHLHRKFVTYELAIDVYDEFIKKLSLKSKGDIRSILLDPNHGDYLSVIEDFVQDPSTVAPDTTISTDPKSILPVVYARRTAALDKIRAVRKELEELGD
ncbi:hypothetical protein BGX31_009080, partial [Mortierella sp. GBA43]